jgi:hypothetical protein
MIIIETYIDVKYDDFSVSMDAVGASLLLLALSTFTHRLLKIQTTLCWLQVVVYALCSLLSGEVVEVLDVSLCDCRRFGPEHQLFACSASCKWCS